MDEDEAWKTRPAAREEGPATQPAFSGAFKTFLDAYPGTQRELLADVEATWLPRLRAHGPAACAIAAAQLRKKVTSKKVLAQRDTLVDSLLDGAGQA